MFHVFKAWSLLTNFNYRVVVGLTLAKTSIEDEQSRADLSTATVRLE